MATRAAQAQSTGSAESEELFQQGREALAKKDYAAACPLLLASERLEAAVGTLISLAECEAALNQLANARQHWQEAATLADAKNDPLHRGKFAWQAFAAIDPRVPRLRIHLAPGAPKDTSFQRDDVAFGAASFEVELPVDPGAHLVTVTAHGHETKRYSMELVEGEHKVLDVEPGAELLVPGPAPTSSEERPPPSVVAPSSPSPPSSPPPLSAVAPGAPPSARSGVSSRRTLAYVVGGVGVVGLGIGTYFGINTILEWNTASSLCPCDGPIRNTATQHKTTAQTDGTVSTIAFAAGGAAAAAAIALWLLAPSTRAVEKTLRFTLTPTIDRRAGALLVQGAW